MFHFLVVGNQQKTQRKKNIFMQAKKKNKRDMFLSVFGTFHVNILISLEIKVKRSFYLYCYMLSFEKLLCFDARLFAVSEIPL